MGPEDVPEGPIVLDTGAFSAIVWSKSGHETFADLARGHPFVLSFASVGELRAGALIANWGERRRTALEDRIGRCIVLPPTSRATTMWAEFYAKHRGQLGETGVNDMWIAATALAQDPALPIMTMNLTDFQTLSSTHPIQLIHPALGT
jgi:predicted nucleic acid-binding protein